MTSKSYITLMIFGAILIAFTIFFTDTHVNADPRIAYPTPVASELDRLAKDIQTNLSEAAGIQDQLTDIRSKLPSFEEFAGVTDGGASLAGGADMPPTPASAPTIAEQHPAPPTEMPTAQPTPQIVERIVYVEVTAAPAVAQPPTPIPPPVYQPAQVQQTNYQPVQASTDPSQWQPFQTGHVRGGTYIYSRAALWMDCTQLYLTGGGQTAASYEGGQIAATLASQPPQEQIAYFHICDATLRQEGKR